MFEFIGYIMLSPLFVALAACSFVYFRRSMHMFQLNMYKFPAQFKWYRQNMKWLALNLIAPFAALAFLLVANLLIDGNEHAHAPWFGLVIILLLLVLIAILVLGVVFFAVGKTKAKKKLVFTPRVLRMCITSGLIYLSAGAILILFFDYALFIFPFVPFLSLFLPLLANFINTPIEKLINLRYINDAKRIMKSHANLVTIGITGSYGKTSTKYFLTSLLSEKFNTLMTPASFNTTMGVVKTIRNQLKATHEIFICEMGLMWLGDIAELCQIVQPKHSILTSIGPQHLETMGSLENIISEKFEIANCINPDNGLVFLNYDNEFIRERELDKKIIRYGLSENARDFRADEITVSDKGTDFTVTAPNGATARFSTRLLGAHNVQNLTGAIAVAHTLGVEMNDLIRLVKRIEPVEHRLQIINKGENIIIDDAFNSNPVGAKAALDVLKNFDGERFLRFLVTPGMVALGEKEFELNKELGEYAKNCCDFAVLINEKQAIPIKAGLVESGFPTDKIHVFKNLLDGLDFVNNYNSDKRKVILLENDLPDNY
ncbi:MAG: UDP-N-acetylmuramoyl-tripeptide--D-alanyl-D-alanine ligase [Oscillospiraceae bacterium]|nr:UDP-N-acetylmuramoyl-tripeptide--D-alanyl-D-alanine ligase [Oscillospiraceae bacterium]